MTKELFDQIIAALLPEMGDPGARKALIEAAFYGSPLLQKIEWSGAARPFTIQLTRLLDQFGEVEPGKPAAARLLEEVREQVGPDRQALIDALLAQLVKGASTPSAQTTIQPPPKTFGDGELYVFISYARPDQAIAEQLETFLTAAGVRVFRDASDIRAGANWDLVIEKALRECHCMVLLLSQASMPDRKEVHREWFRFDQQRKTIYPLYLQDCTLHSRFDSINYIDARSDLQGALERLIKDLRREFPQPTPIPVSTPQSSDARRAVELAYLERLHQEELGNTRRYTPVGGASQKRVEIRAVFEHRPFELMSLGEGRRQKEPRRFENAVEELLRIRRAALLGEPGGGKTTTLWKLAADLVEAALHDPKAPIPLLIPLGRWTDADHTLEAFLASYLGDLGESLGPLLDEKRAALLLDGLNELPVGQRDVKYPQVQRLIEQRPALLAIVSCRELDYTIDLKLDRVAITALDPARIREFVGRYLGEEQGEEFFWRLAGGIEVQKVWELWRLAGASFDLFWTAPDIPRENPNVYDATIHEHDRIWRDKVRGKHSLMELSRNPFMLMMLTSVYAEQGALPENRGELFQLFVETLLSRERIPQDEQTLLNKGLASVAYSMQIRRANGEEHDGSDALTVITKEEAQTLLDERRLYLAESASILSVGQQVRFSHQLLQEYFAARYMDKEIHGGRLKASEIWPPKSWWERTNWEEAAILLAGLYSKDYSRIVEWAAEANPEVAAMCIVRSGAEWNQTKVEALRAHWLPRLTDLKGDPNPEARAAIGRALGVMGLDKRKGVGTINKNGGALPDIDWVEIPAGEFQYGDESDHAAKPQRINLPPFHISRYPITYAQFHTFLDHPEGVGDLRWFEGLAAKEEERQISEQSFKYSNHPRETVSWYQAMAFSRWLSWRQGGGYDLKKVEEWVVRLPTEYEWEKAARGEDGRIYPYKGDYDAAKANTSETGLGQTSAVGMFSNGASPYEVMDMSGNVWEWCMNSYEISAREPGKEDLRAEKNRALRGGSWASDHILARTVVRGLNHPAASDFGIGFRLLCLVRPPSL